MQPGQAFIEEGLLYRETFDHGPGAWATGKNQDGGSWHRNIFGFQGAPAPLSWSPADGRSGGCAYTEPPWYFDDNHGEFAWLYLLFFVNRSELLGLRDQDLRGVRIQLTLRGQQCDLQGTRLYFWIQGYGTPQTGTTGATDTTGVPGGQSTPHRSLYNWALTSSPLDHVLLDGEWHDATVVLVHDEAKWSSMGLLNGGLAHRINVLQSLDCAAGSLDDILGGGHVNFGFLLCGVDPNHPPIGRICLDQISIWASEG